MPAESEWWGIAGLANGAQGKANDVQFVQATTRRIALYLIPEVRYFSP